MPNDFPVIVPPSGLIQAGALANAGYQISLNPEHQDEPLQTKSLLGTPIYASLIFKALSGKDLNNLGEDVKKIVSYDFEMTQILMTIDQTKNIVKTALNGRPGTVKEYISKGDYMINVSGLVVGKFPLVYPGEAVKALATFLDLQQSIEVASQFLSLYGITDVVVEEYKFADIKGSRNQVGFSFSLLSDTDFKIEPTQVTVQSQRITQI